MSELDKPFPPTPPEPPAPEPAPPFAVSKVPLPDGSIQVIYSDGSVVIMPGPAGEEPPPPPSPVPPKK